MNMREARSSRNRRNALFETAIAQIINLIGTTRMLSLSSAPMGFAPAMAPARATARVAAPVMETKAELVKLADDLNPVRTKPKQ